MSHYITITLAPQLGFLFSVFGCFLLSKPAYGLSGWGKQLFSKDYQ